MAPCPLNLKECKISFSQVKLASKGEFNFGRHTWKLHYQNCSNGDSFNFGDFFWKNPRKTLNFKAGMGATFSGISGTLRGQGQSKLLGIFKGLSGNLHFLVKS